MLAHEILESTMFLALRKTHDEDYVITRGGEPIARLIAAQSPDQDQAGSNVSALIRRIEALCDSGKPVEFDPRKAIEEGRD